MEERFREHYFVLLRIVLLLILEIYIILSQSVLTGASVKALLILALFIGVIAGKELVERRLQGVFFGCGRNFITDYTSYIRNIIYFVRSFSVL